MATWRTGILIAVVPGLIAGPLSSSVPRATLHAAGTAGRPTIQDAGRDSARRVSRYVSVRSDLRAKLEELLGDLSPDADLLQLDRVETVAAALAPGDRVFFSFFPISFRDPTFEVEVVKGFGPWVGLRIHGSGEAFETAAAAIEAYRRRTLLEIESVVEFSLRELRWPTGSTPIVRLAYQTAKTFGCVPYRIEAELTRTSAPPRLELELLGISPPGEICSPMIGPARGGMQLDLPPGSYPLTIRYRTEEDRYRLVLTDSSMQLRPERSTFTRADEALRLRFPVNSFALYCAVPGERGPLCRRLEAWIAGRSGITAHRFGARGEVPYPSGAGSDATGRAYFRFTVPLALGPVRNCLETLSDVVAGLRGIGFTVETWTGERMSTPLRQEPVDGAAGPVAEASECLPAIPPPTADSLGIDASEVDRYAPNWEAPPLSCRPPFDGSTGDDPARATSADGANRATGAVALPDRWRESAARRMRGIPIVAQPNTTRSALSRSQLLYRLREWRCRGGRTLGDAVAYPGSAWLWVEHQGDWYFLLPRTTAAGVDAYLERVDRYGDVAWTIPAPSRPGPKRVRIGPDDILILGFHLYRWRP